MKKLTLLLIAGLCFSVSVGAQNKQEQAQIAFAKAFVKSKGLTWGGQGRYATKGLYTYSESNKQYYGKAYFGIGGTLAQQFAPLPPGAKQRIPGWKKAIDDRLSLASDTVTVSVAAKTSSEIDGVKNVASEIKGSRASATPKFVPDASGKQPTASLSNLATAPAPKRPVGGRAAAAAPRAAATKSRAAAAPNLFRITPKVLAPKPRRATNPRATAPKPRAKPALVTLDAKTFEKLDANKDGVISKKEFLKP